MAADRAALISFGPFRLVNATKADAPSLRKRQHRKITSYTAVLRGNWVLYVLDAVYPIDSQR